MALIHGFCNRALKKGEVVVELKHEIPLDHHDLAFAKAVRTTRDLGQMKIWLLVAAPVVSRGGGARIAHSVNRPFASCSLLHTTLHLVSGTKDEINGLLTGMDIAV